ncbi:cytochrome c3 family protein [Geobacter sp. DSM 9736]|uniref:cytochrome c3 family protein n=1 Tax=Geobacter sp. DSM 9736 TaxID=1277350 RepID=UPI000B61B465|nr:cytochrome c3 family protein [Geobacter sp. DSM 9736]SNB45333.1 c(7)-type cytochrome triheme domain-containing protein [Geobacter sp. DSM 9736]
MKGLRSNIAGVGFLMFAVTAFAVVGGGDIVLKGGKAGPAHFSHSVHVEAANTGCKECHPKLYLDVKQHKSVKMADMQKGKSCGACHNGKRAFGVKGDCAKCHKK